MKLTWFGETALRLHYGGEIVVLDGARARGVEPAEIVSGADRVIDRDEPTIEAFDAERFEPPRARRAIDADAGAFAPRIFRIEGGLVLASGEEPLLVVLGGAGALDFAAWADGAVVVVAHEVALAGALAALEAARPRLVVLALGDDAVARAMEALRPALGRAGLMVLEEGLALEI